jgi:hypothetical protein
MNYVLAFLMTVFMLPAFAQRPGPDPLYPPPPNKQGYPNDYWHPDRYPHWCHDYDRRDYWREKRACRDDWNCVSQVNRKGRRCGLR